MKKVVYHWRDTQSDSFCSGWERNPKNQRQGDSFCSKRGSIIELYYL
jgi:hypothetical protein